MAFRMPQTPMSALGLSQTLPRVAAQAQRERNEERRRRKRVVLVVVAICSLVLLYELAQWTIGGALAAAQRRATQRAVDDIRLKRQQGASQLEAEQMQAAQRGRANKGFRDNKKIVLLVTNFRDSHACGRMLAEAHTLAYLPARVHFRVLDEVDLGEDDTCVKVFCDALPDVCTSLVRSKQLRFATRDASGALGVTVAKHLVESMVSRTEFADDFYVSVNPSVSFTQDWDLALLKQWHSIGNDMAILSVAPKALQLKGRASSATTILLQCSARIHSKSRDAVVAFNAPEPKPKVQSALFAPVLQAQYSELFHFGPVEALLAIRSDPHTPHIAVGHEYARATRFWTHGYDFYAPVDDIVFATYAWRPSVIGTEHGDGGNVLGSDAALQALVERSNRRIRRLLQLPVSSTASEPLVDENKYALGSRRAMAQWQSFSHIDPQAPYNESTTNQFVACDARLQFVRYEF